LLGALLVTSCLNLRAVWIILTWGALFALTSSWVAFSVWFSTSGLAESGGVAVWVGQVALVAFLGLCVTLGVLDVLAAYIMARQSIWELTIVALSALLGGEVTSVTLAVSSSEISWAGEVEWGSGLESTAFENGLTNTSVAQGSTQAPSASDTLMFSNTGVAVTETVALIIWSISFCDNSNFSWLWKIS